jgi:hypothetical protein
MVDLQDQVHISAWSDHHVITKPLFDLLPFGRTFDPTSFYAYVDYQLPTLADAASQNLLFWSLSGIRHHDGTTANQISLFYDDTFFWHYYVPEKREEIIEHLHNGNRIRFLSRFHISETQTEIEFNEIRLQIQSGETQLVYTDSKEYTYKWETARWETHTHSFEFTLINPQIFARPPEYRSDYQREARYRVQLSHLLSESNNTTINASYWGSVDSSPRVSRNHSPSLPSLVFSPIPRHCPCGIDVCRCDIRYPGTPPTPPDLELWDPRRDPQPLLGVHVART